MWGYLIALAILSFAVWKLAFSKPKPPPFNPTTIKFEPSKKLSSPGNILRKEVKKKQPGQIGIRFLYGSQTGTAEDFATTLADEANTYGFFTEVTDLDDYDPEDLAEEEMVILCLATYGEGEPTDNAKDFYEWLMSEEREENQLTNVKFTVFGLGNKTYEHYNAIGKNVDKRLSELGAQRAFELGLGDDDAGLQEDFDKWRGRLWEPLCSSFGMEFKKADAVITPSYELIVCNNDVKLSSSATWYTKGINREIIDVKNPFYCKVVMNRELHSEKSERSCRHIEIELNEKMRYQTGDHVGIFPENARDEVERWIQHFNLDRNQIVKIVRKDDPNRPLLGPCTIERILLCFLDIVSPPRKKLLQALATLYTKDEKEKERLFQLASSTEEGWKEYNDYIKTPCRTLLEVVEDFPSCSPSFIHLLELVPPLQHRFYSISSSSKAYPSHVHVTSVLVNYTTQTGRLHKGICTNWLLTREMDALVPCFIRTSTFRLPTDHSVPVILIGPGSGIAPFRGFLQERRAVKSTGECILFFGCRRSDEDFLYADELKSHLEDGSLTQLITAFSRETDAKVYVQHRMLELKNKIWEMLQNKAFIYVCGDAKYMAKDVHKAFRQIVEEAGGKSKQEAESFITALQTSDPIRYQQDVWT